MIVKDFAKKYDVSHQTVYRWIRQGRLLVTEVEINNFLVTDILTRERPKPRRSGRKGGANNASK